MGDEDRLLERIAKLRDALASIRERDPRPGRDEAGTQAAYGSYAEEVRRLAERALEADDAADRT